MIAMKKGWTYKKLGEVCDLYQPQTISTKDLIPDGMYNVFGANGIIGKYDKYNHEQSEILMTCRGATCGTINESTPKSWITGNSMVIHIKDERIINKSFLKYALSFIDKTNIITGAAQPQITRQALYPLPISYPALSEQLYIVSRLDNVFAHIDALKANAEKQLTESRNLFQKALEEAMKPKDGWEVKRMIDVGEIINGFAFPSTAFNEKYEIKSIKITNVGVGCFIEDEGAKLPQQYINSAKNYVTKENDIVIALTRTVINEGLKVAVVPASYNNSLLNQRVAAIRANSNIINSNYLYYYLRTKHVKEYVLRKVNTLMQPNLSIVDFRNMPLPYTPLDNQYKIVSRLDSLNAKVRDLEEIQQKTIDDCEALKQAMLREVFE